MRFERLEIDGAYLVEQQPVGDERGSFARTFCVREFALLGLQTRFVQHSVSISRARHTIRGMHLQKPPHGEVKVVSCIRGAIYDVLVDLRPNARTYMQWQGIELSEANGRSLYIPKGCAHGFQSLTNDAAVSYLISEFHAPSASTGVRFDDPAIGIIWPFPPSVISAKDRDWPLFQNSVWQPAE